MAAYDAEYVAARSVLLDALQALGSQREAIVVVGAQAVYMRTGDDGIAVAPYTTDADLALSPAQLSDEPHIEELMSDADFRQDAGPGVWKKTVNIEGLSVDIPVDLMVPAGFAPPGSGRRSVKLPPHDRMIARQAVGLEGTVLDNDLMRVAALDTTDPRAFMVKIAGPAALMVAKVHKLRDRIAEGNLDRIADKDASDVYRLMVAVPTSQFLDRLRPLLTDPVAGPPCNEGVELIRQLFGVRAGRGVRMASDALRVGVPPERVADVCVAFVRQVGEGLRDG